MTYPISTDELKWDELHPQNIQNVTAHMVHNIQNRDAATLHRARTITVTDLQNVTFINKAKARVDSLYRAKGGDTRARLKAMLAQRNSS